MIEAIYIIYLDALCNSDTDMIFESLPKIMDHLMKSHGHVTYEDMHDKASVDMVFSAVNKIRDLCILNEQSKSDRQLTNILYIIFDKPLFLMDALKVLNKRTTNETYADFKTHIYKGT